MNLLKNRKNFFENRDLTGLTSLEIVKQYVKFENEVNGLEDIKFDGGAGLLTPQSRMITEAGHLKITNLKQVTPEKYAEELVRALIASEDPTKCTEITEL